MSEPGPDPYGSADLRRAVRTAWAASPARFREDANAEEDLARGGYRDRVVVELAQNAADAALRAGVPGRLLLSLDGDELLAANTGAPLDAAGAAALSTLRASAKRAGEPTGTVGRFGVGFAAVRAVADDVTVRSRDGALRWSLDAARRALAELAQPHQLHQPHEPHQLREEVARRGDALPVLRLPEPAPDAPPLPDVEGPWATAVRLRLRDASAVALVGQLLDGVDDALLLPLPALAEVVVEVDGRRRRLAAERSADGGVVVRETRGSAERTTRWRQTSADGALDPALLADRPVEERARPGWAVAVAVPVDPDGRPQPLPAGVARVLHAPTPTDEPVTLPALVVASVPLEPSRRRAAPGPATDAVLAAAADAYARLVRDLAAGDRGAGPGLLDLVPPALGEGAVDAALGAAVLDRLRRTAWLPAADGSGLLRPDAAALVPALRGAADPAALAAHVAGLVDPRWAGRAELRRLGVREVDLAEVLDALASVPRVAERWRELYAALDGADREAIGALPVPLADGRVVRGPRGVLLVPPELAGLAAVLAPLRLRVVDPAAAHPLLLRLGGVEATPAALLADPAVVAAVEGAEDAVVDGAGDAEDEADAVASAVLALLAATSDGVEQHPWLAGLLLRDADGELAPAGELVLPGSVAADLLDPEEVSPVAPSLVSAVGADVLERAGVLAGLAVVRDADVPLDGTADHELDGEAEWAEELTAAEPDDAPPPVLVELAAVRDLDLVRPDAWPAALAALAADPRTRAAVLDPALVVGADGRRRTARSYTAWELARVARVGGVPLSRLRSVDAEPALAGLYDPVELPAVDPAVLAAVGVRTTVAELVSTPAGAQDLLDRLADPARVVPAPALASLLPYLAALDPAEVEAPARVRVPAGDGTAVVDPDDVLVADAPCWVQLGGAGLLPAPPALAAAIADVLDVDLAEDAVPADLTGGTATEVPATVRRLLPTAPDTYVRHDRLLVAGGEVAWWTGTDGTVHAVTPDGLARGLAWGAGRWSARGLVAEVLRSPDAVDRLVAETWWDA